ncbi:MAG: cell division ATP-binding protein FtsE [Saccharofermentans sp.]|nr:cell division ATP-binding protein FtsE [Saccharofermentans sp.]
MIDFINVEKTYRSGVEALKGVNFTIEDGEFVFIIGKSGSGKSTLLKCITCEERPTSGKVTIDNFDISHMSRALIPVLRRKIGMIYQDFRLIETKTVAENVAFAGEIIGVPKQSLNNTVQICLSVVGLKDKADCYPQELSGGEQQRVAIARAMVNNPSLIVADEPTGNLDPETSEAIMAMLLEINRNGNSGNKTTVIICTHDSAMVDRMKQRVIEIEDGRITRDEKKSGYKGDQTDHEAYIPHPSRTDAYSGSSGAVAFGDDEEYSDNFDDPGYGSSAVVSPVGGVVFGEEAVNSMPVSVPEDTFEPVVEEIIETPVEEIIEPESVAAAEQPVVIVPEEPEKEEDLPKAEVSEINVLQEESVLSFGDEAVSGSVIPGQPEKKDTDPDITSDSGFSFPNEENSEALKEAKREQKQKAREEKLAFKEAKRKEKLDKKKKVRRTDFKPGSDIDLFPEDDE